MRTRRAGGVDMTAGTDGERDDGLIVAMCGGAGAVWFLFRSEREM